MLVDHLAEGRSNASVGGQISNNGLLNDQLLGGRERS